jgi:Protein of unknown function (DUF3311)
MSDRAGGKRRRFRLTYLFLLIPYIAILWVPTYNSLEPELAGIPFFYWYQLLWIVLGALLLFPVYFFETRDGE